MKDKTKKMFYALFVAIVVAWDLGFLLAPILKYYGAETIASLLYWFYSFFDHQMPSRSFFILGEQFAVCQRDLPLYLMFLLGTIVYGFVRKIGDTKLPNSWWLALAFIPILIDGGIQLLGLVESTPFRRTVTGGLFGIITAFFILPLYYETIYVIEEWWNKRKK